MKQENDIKQDIEKLKCLPILQQDLYSIYLKRLKDLEQQIDEQEFRITIVGEFSAGKSTFLNALIGKDVLPHATSETTAAVTYIKNTKPTDEACHTIVVRFFEETREPVIYDVTSDPHLLRNYATTMSKTMNVVEEVSSITLHIPFEHTDEPIVFIDTPGLNGMAEGHYERMLYEIQRSHASIYLFQIRGLSQSNRQLYELLTQYQESFIFVMNFIDELKHEEGDDLEQKITEFKASLHQLGIEEDVPVFGISALQALAARDHNMKRIYATDQRDLTEEDRERLWEKSQFATLESYIWDEIIAKEKERVRISNYERKFNEIVRDLQYELEYQKQLSEVSVDEQTKKKIQNRINKLVHSKGQNWENVENFIVATERNERKLLFATLKEKLEKICNITIDEVDEMDLQQLQQLTSGNSSLMKKADQQITRLYNDLNESATQLLTNLHTHAALEAQQYFPMIQIEREGIDLSLQLEKPKLEEESFLAKKEQAEREIKKVKQKFAPVTSSYEKQKQQLKDAELELQTSEYAQRQLEERRNRLLRNLRTRPEVTTREERYERPVRKKKFLGGLRSLFGGEKYKTVYETAWRTVVDDAEAKAWDREKEMIEKEYGEERNRLRKQLKMLRQRHEKLEADTGQAHRRVNQLERRLESAEKKYEEAEKAYREIYLKFERSYVQKLKRKTSKTVEQEFAKLENEIRDQIKFQFEKEIKVLTESIREFYEELYKQQVDNLTNLLQRKQQNERTSENKMLELAIRELVQFQKEGSLS